MRGRGTRWGVVEKGDLEERILYDFLMQQRATVC